METVNIDVNKIYCGDALKVLKKLPAKSVRCIVTSPPYWGQRDYGTGLWIGGDTQCKHSPANTPAMRGIASSSLGGGKKHTGHRLEGFKDKCAYCGAMRIDKQLGMERTPELYVKNLLKILMESRRVLTDDGTLWLNLGDSYAGSGKGFGDNRNDKGKQGENAGSINVTGTNYYTANTLKAKDLVGIPWMVAFALRKKGWFLRCDIIWHKTNCMPESVTDRPTKNHEYIFLFSKSSKYYYDYEAIKTKLAESTLNDSRLYKDNYENNRPERDVAGGNNQQGGGLIKRKADRQRGHVLPHAGFNNKWDNMTLAEQQANGANKRSVWTVATKPFKDAHFATFPVDLIIDCIKAGSAPGDTILDPFMGAGTTALAAAKLGRNFIGAELNEKYINIARKRLQKELGLFNPLK